jgi:hypothetical protein
VFEQLPASLVHRASWELELSFLVDCFSLGKLLVSAHYSFSKMVEGAVIFLRLQLGHHTPTLVGSAQNSASPRQAEVKISLCLLGHQFCPGGV